MDKTLLSIGHGYSARALARLLVPEGWTLIGSSRSADKAAEFRTAGVSHMIWPGERLPLDRVTHVLTSVAPGKSGDPVLAEAVEQLKTAKHLEWVGYLSTTGVYGDRDGDWVDETSELHPTTRRGHARVEAEDAWESLDLPLHIFRLAGIYGPGRGPFAKVRAGNARRIIKEGQVFSRIHVEDIAQVLAASMARPNPGAIYNVCVPIPPAVPFYEAEMTPMARSFYAESKRVRNNRIKEELGVSLIYPGYRQGLTALLKSEETTHPR